jgi:opacity protein-like surface antigen
MKLFLTLAMSAAISAFGADVALTLGVGNGTSKVSNNGQTVEAKSTTSVMITPGGDIVNVGVVAIGWEIPVAFGGPARALISNGQINTEKMDFMLVPGARVRIAPISRLSPWASVGVGLGRFDRASASSASNLLQSATASSFAISVGVGLDFKVAGPLFLRAEGRNFNYKSVDDLRRNSFQFLIGAGLRF